MWDKIKEKMTPIKTLANYQKISREAEDEHGHILARNLDALKEKLRRLEFQELGIFGEIKKVGEAWGMARDMPKGCQLHVRAVKDPQFENHYVLGAHLEAHRQRAVAHLQGDSDHKKGGKLLRMFLGKTKMFKNRCVKINGKRCKVSVDKTLNRKDVKQLFCDKK